MDRYEEALERAKAGKPIDEVFPELKESDDERIRKWIISHFHECFIACVDNVEYQEYINNKVIPWLEKQKEKKPVEYLDKDKVYAIMTKLTSLSYSQLIPINSDEYKKIDEITGDVSRLLDYPIEPNPAEWNEEDEKELDCIINVLDRLGFEE